MGSAYGLKSPAYGLKSLTYGLKTPLDGLKRLTFRLKNPPNELKSHPAGLKPHAYGLKSPAYAFKRQANRLGALAYGVRMAVESVCGRIESVFDPVESVRVSFESMRLPVAPGAAAFDCLGHVIAMRITALLVVVLLFDCELASDAANRRRRSLRAQRALPHAHDAPTRSAERAGHGAITRDVAVKLRQPEFESGLRRVSEAAAWMSVPETAVHKHDDPFAREDKIRLSEKRDTPPPAADSVRAKQHNQTQLGILVAGPANARHDSAALRWRKYVGHQCDYSQ